MFTGGNGNHYVEVSKSGKKRFYITKDTHIGTPHATSTGSNAGIETSLESPKSIIPPVFPDYNPQTGNDTLYGGVELNIDNNQRFDLFGYTNPYSLEKRKRGFM